MAHFSEFYCNPVTGSNMNGGSDENASPSYSATNGGWNSTTGVFTPASGDPSASVTVGQFASVFLDGATTPVFYGRVTAVNSTTVTVSTTAASGTAPTTNASGRSINVGGAWKGPNGIAAHPFGLITASLVNSSGNAPRVNFKNNATYSITAAMTQSGSGPIFFEGYTTTVGDGGRFTLDGGTSGAAYNMLTISGNYCLVKNAVFQNNGASGEGHGLLLSGRSNSAVGCVFHDLRGAGWFGNGGVVNWAIECEAYACNQSNTSGRGAFHAGGPAFLVRCVAHDNVGSNAHGFSQAGNSPSAVVHCVFDTNGGAGVRDNSNAGTLVVGCDFYGNTGSGFHHSGTSGVFFWIENSNFLTNAYGIRDEGNGSSKSVGHVVNCGFGSGNKVNTSGATTYASGTAHAEVATITYASDVAPWTAQATGDFRVNLAAAKGTGRGTFTQTAASYTGTVAYPDVGSAQHQESGPTSGFSIIQSAGVGRG